MRGHVASARDTLAFSLVEIMVAVGLLSFIIIGLVLSFNQVQRAFRAGTGQADVLEGGRAAMNVITRDLQELSASGRSFVTNFQTYAGYPPTLQDLPSGDLRTNRLYDLFFIAKRNDEYAIIAYRVDATNGGLSGTLSRFETNVFGTNLAYHLRTNIMNWLSTSDDFHRIAGNVVHFRAIPYDTNGLLYPFTNNVIDAPYGPQPDGWGTAYAFTNDVLPAFVDVEMAVIEPDTAERLRIRAERNAQQGLDYLRQRAGRVDVFRQRVPIRPAATSVRPPG